MFFADIHNHLLYGTDDGPKTYEEMIAMADASYEDGVRVIFATPHFYPKCFGDNIQNGEKAFEELTAYCAGKYPDLKLFLGNELFFIKGSSTWLKNGVCRTLGQTRFALLEFKEDVSVTTVDEATERLLNRGFVPVIAHAERFYRLGKKDIEWLKSNGVKIQVNASVFDSGCPLWLRLRLRWLMAKKFVDFVATDAHDMVGRPPEMKKYFKYVSEKYGEEYARDIFWNNAEKLLLKDVSEEEHNG